MSYELDYNIYQEQIEWLKIILTELGIENLLDITDPDKKYIIMAKLYLVKSQGVDIKFKFDLKNGKVYSSDIDFILQKIRSYYSDTYCILPKEDKKKIEKVKSLSKYIDYKERQWYIIAAVMIYANDNQKQLNINPIDENLAQIGMDTGCRNYDKQSCLKIIEILKEENLLKN